MDTKLDAFRIVQDLSPAHWAKGGGLGKEVAPALAEAGVQDALKSLARAIEALDLDLFSTAKIKTAEQAESRVAAARAALGKELKAVVTASRTLEASARKALAAFKSRKLDPKGPPAAAAQIADSASRFAVALPAQAEDALTALEDLQAELLAQQEEQAAKAAKSSKGGEPKDAKAAEAALALTPAFQLLRKKAIEGLRVVKNTPAPALAEQPMCYLVGLGGKRGRVYIARKVSSAHRKLIKQLLPDEAALKFYDGVIAWEAKAFTFIGAQIPGGFAKKVQRGLLEQTKNNFRIRARRLDGQGEIEEAAGDADPDSLDLDTGEAAAPAATGHAPGGRPPALPSRDERVAALRARLAKLKPELDAVLAAAGPKAPALKKAADELQALLKDGKPGTALLLLRKLEDAVYMEVSRGTADATGGAGDAAAPGTGGSADAGPKAQAEELIRQLTALVLGGLDNDAARNAINADLKKLQAAFDKAAKAGKPAAQDKAYAAVRDAAAKLLERAQVTNTGEDFAAARLEPAFAQAAKAVTGLPMGRAREVLLAELDSLRSDAGRYETAGDASALQHIVQPRLTKLLRVAGAIPAIAAALQKNLSEAEAALAKLDATASAELRARLATLKEQAANDFPAGHTLDEIDAEDKLILPAAHQLAQEAKALGPILARRAEIAQLRQRLEAMKPRLDAAAAAGQPTFIDTRQKKIQELRTQFDNYAAKDDLKSCEVIFSNLGAQLDGVEAAKRNHAAALKKYQDAKAGAIASAKKAKLQPASLAALRDKSLDAKGAAIEKLLDGGQLPKANKSVDDWIKQAGTWAKSPAVYNNLRSGHPKKGAMKDLIGEPGGGEVFDAIVADLPQDTSTETMTDAIDARFGVSVKQFNHRKADKDEGLTYSDGRRETPPDAPQKGLKELYGILRMVPVKDVKTIERFEDNLEQGNGALYAPGVFNDDVVMYSGRPDDATNTMPLGNVGTLVPPGMALDPRAEPAGGAVVSVQSYTHSALHEVGHGVDDDLGMMKKHMVDAGWETHGTSDVAEVVARHYVYDEGYVKDLLKNNGQEPKNPPRVPKGGDAARWEANRQRVVQWARQQTVKADPWANPVAAQANAIGGRVYHEGYKGDWFSYRLAARALGVRDYQFRSHYEWFAELYAAFHLGQLKPAHPAYTWLDELKRQQEA